MTRANKTEKTRQEKKTRKEDKVHWQIWVSARLDAVVEEFAARKFVQRSQAILRLVVAGLESEGMAKREAGKE